MSYSGQTAQRAETRATFPSFGAHSQGITVELFSDSDGVTFFIWSSHRTCTTSFWLTPIRLTTLKWRLLFQNERCRTKKGKRHALPWPKQDWALLKRCWSWIWMPKLRRNPHQLSHILSYLCSPYPIVEGFFYELLVKRHWKVLFQKIQVTLENFDIFLVPSLIFGLKTFFFSSSISNNFFCKI